MKRKLFPGGPTTGVRFLEASIRRIDTRAEGEEAIYEIAISSEAEVERQSIFGGSYREVLDHSPNAVQMGRLKSGRMAFLADHDPTRQLGVLKNGRVDSDHVIRANVSWGVSQLAAERKAEIDAGTGVGASISVGYIPKRWKLIEEDEERGDLWRASLWEPVEASSVSIPADDSVGFGRDYDMAGRYPVETEEERSMNKKKVLDERGQVIEVNEDDPRTALTETQVRAISNGSPVPPAKKSRQDEVREIFEMCETNGVPVKREWITDESVDADRVGRLILESRKAANPAQPGSERIVDLPDKDASRYSYARAILMAAGLNPRGGDGLEIKREGLEWEMHREISKKLPTAYRDNGGLFVPIALQKRTLDSVTKTAGAETVFDQPADLITMFRKRARLAALGAQVLSGLTGPVVFPRQTGGMTFDWMPENGGVDVTQTDIAFGLLTLSPKTVMGGTKYSRQLLQMAPSSGLDIESMVRNEIGIGHALEIDRVGFHGLGSDGEPLGLFGTPSVQSMDLSTPSWTKLLTAIGLLAGIDAPIDNLSWVTTPEKAATFASTPIVSAQGVFLWQGTLLDGTMAGHRATSTNQIVKTFDDSLVVGASTKHGVALGDFTQAVIGMWGALEIVVDPYKYKLQGLIDIGTFQMMDVVFRHPEAFAVEAL